MYINKRDGHRDRRGGTPGFYFVLLLNFKFQADGLKDGLKIVRSNDKPPLKSSYLQSSFDIVQHVNNPYYTKEPKQKVPAVQDCHFNSKNLAYMYNSSVLSHCKRVSITL